MTRLQQLYNSTEFRYVYSHIDADEYIKYDNAINETLKEKVFTTKLHKNKLLTSDFESVSCIYILFNKSNNTVYVGQTGNIYRRLLSHKTRLLKRALDAGDDLIIKIVPMNEDERHFWERWFIKYYQLRYNSCNRSWVTVDNLDKYTFTPQMEDM